MSRKRCHRRVITPMPPRGMRPGLRADQVRDLGLCHHVHVDALASGDADEAVLWQWVGGVLTWSRVAGLTGHGVPEMRQVLEMTTSLVRRFGQTGRVVCTGPELCAMRDAAGYMDQLAGVVDRFTAIEAAEWSEARLHRMRASALPMDVQLVAGVA